MYRMARVTYTIIPPNNTSYYDGLQSVYAPLTFTVPTTTGIPPNTTQTAYLAFNSCRVERIQDKLHQRTFVPYVLANTTLTQGP